MQESNPAPEYPFPWMPLAIGDVTLVAWDGFSYVDQLGRTYRSGAEPSAEDAIDAVAHPATRALEPRRAALRARAKQRRREVEEGGITLPNGAQIDTDNTSQSKLDGALSLASLSGLGAQFETKWKCADGTFRTVTQSDLIALALAVGTHVQACFQREAALSAAIDAADTPEDLDEVALEIEAFALSTSA